MSAWVRRLRMKTRVASKAETTKDLESYNERYFFSKNLRRVLLHAIRHRGLLATATNRHIYTQLTAASPNYLGGGPLGGGPLPGGPCGAPGAPGGGPRGGGPLLTVCKAHEDVGGALHLCFRCNCLCRMGPRHTRRLVRWVRSGPPEVFRLRSN